MDDYTALAQRVAVSVGDVRGCLVLSRDGLVLGAYPEDDETIAKPAWLKFAALGDSEKSFVEFGAEIWVYAHRGPYACFAVAGTTIRPGVLLDTMEQALLAAEEARTRRDGLKLPEATQAPSGKPRTPLHPPTERQAPAKVAAGAKPAGTQPTDKATKDDAEQKRPEPKLVGAEEKAEEDDAFVDKVMLAQEFSGLLQSEDGDDEGSS
jgi:hypothetical protein